MTKVLGSPAHGLRVVDHLVHGHGDGPGVPVDAHPQAVPDQQHVQPCRLGELGSGIVVGGQKGDPFTALFHPVEIDNNTLSHRQNAAVAGRSLTPGRERDIIPHRPADQLRQFLFVLRLYHGVRDGTADDRFDQIRHGRDIMTVEFSLQFTEIHPATEFLFEKIPLLRIDTAHFPSSLANIDPDQDISFSAISRFLETCSIKISWTISQASTILGSARR